MKSCPAIAASLRRVLLLASGCVTVGYDFLKQQATQLTLGTQTRGLKK
jgi:hypothetical protein